MADAAAALTDHLRRDGGVSALVGRRVHLEVAPMSDRFPRLLVSVAATDRPAVLKGSARQPVTRLQLACQGQGVTGAADALALAQAVLDSTGGVSGGQRLEEYGGAYLGTDPAARVWCKNVRFDDEVTAAEESPGGAQPWIRTVLLACSVAWNEVSFS